MCRPASASQGGWAPSGAWMPSCSGRLVPFAVPFTAPFAPAPWPGPWRPLCAAARAAGLEAGGLEAADAVDRPLRCVVELGCFVGVAVLVMVGITSPRMMLAAPWFMQHRLHSRSRLHELLRSDRIIRPCSLPCCGLASDLMQGSGQPDAGGHAAGQPVAAEREEPRGVGHRAPRLAAIVALDPPHPQPRQPVARQALQISPPFAFLRPG